MTSGMCEEFGDRVTVPDGTTDASMMPYHVARSKLFVRERFSKAFISLDIPQIEENIEQTRFPVPHDKEHESTDDFLGLVRAGVAGAASRPKTLGSQYFLFSR